MEVILSSNIFLADTCLKPGFPQDIQGSRVRKHIHIYRNKYTHTKIDRQTDMHTQTHTFIHRQIHINTQACMYIHTDKHILKCSVFVFTYLLTLANGFSTGDCKTAIISSRQSEAR